jgi:predicted kinase
MIEILIGNIASGKSTWTTERAKQGALIINDDSIVESLHGGNYKLYSEELKPVYKGIGLMTAIMGAMQGRDLIIDSTNLTKARRARWIGMARMLDVPVVGIVFEQASPAEHAGRRVKHDARGYDFDHWLKIARMFAIQWQEPDISEGFDNLVPIEQARTMNIEGMWATSMLPEHRKSA